MVHPEVERVAEEIATMETRGAATIADAAAGALAVEAREFDGDDPAAFRARLRNSAGRLYKTRPTAVSLLNALRYVLHGMEGSTVERLRASVVERAAEFRDDLSAAQARLGRIGAGRIRDGDAVMTHCHSTAAMAVVEAAAEAGKDVSAVVKETRPRNQGHITARELHDLGVPVTLIVDNAAHRYLDEVDHLLVGADSVAADGSVVNKIGTSGLAVSARERGVPVTVAAGTIKLHPDTLTGHAVEIEGRDETEVIDEETRAELGDIEVRNPAFDVTAPRYVDAIVTERGQFPPESIVTLMRELYGEADRPWEHSGR